MEKFTLRNAQNFNSAEQQYKSEIGEYFSNCAGTTLDKLNNFARFVPRQALSLFLAKNELFKNVVDVHGAIVECGVFMGGGLFSWAQFSAIHEPVNHNRRIIGFDSFEGFPSLGKEDGGTSDDHKHQGAYAFGEMAELTEGARLFDLNRQIGQIPKIELVKGDANQTIPAYVADNTHLVVALLYLDFDLFEPTVTALRHFLPRMPRGAVLAFDELNQAQWPGETMAVLQEVGLGNLRIRRFPFTPSLSYAILGD